MLGAQVCVEGDVALPPEERDRQVQLAGAAELLEVDPAEVLAVGRLGRGDGDLHRGLRPPGETSRAGARRSWCPGRTRRSSVKLSVWLVTFFAVLVVVITPGIVGDVHRRRVEVDRFRGVPAEAA